MQNHLICIFLALLLSALACSCTEDIDFAVDAESPIVVKCILRRGSKQCLSLFYARKYSGSEVLPVKNADAELVCDGETVAKFVKSEGGDWSANFTPDFGKEYILKINIPGRDIIGAKISFPNKVQLVFTSKIFPDEYIKEMWEKYNKRIGKFSYCYYISDVEHKPVRGAYKLWIFWTEVSYRLSCLDMKYLKPFFYLDNIPPQLSEYAATDHPGVDDFNLTEKKVANLKFLNRQLPKLIFIGECWRKVLIPDLPLHSELLRIEHPRNFVNPNYMKDPVGCPLYDQNCFTLSGELDFDSIKFGDHPLAYSDFYSEYFWQCFVSDEYDKYLKDVYTKYFNKDNFVLSQYDADNIYTNINEGVGIFGAVHYGYYIKSADDLLEEPPI